MCLRIKVTELIDHLITDHLSAMETEPKILSPLTELPISSKSTSPGRRYMVSPYIHRGIYISQLSESTFIPAKRYSAALGLVARGILWTSHCLINICTSGS